MLMQMSQACVNTVFFDDCLNPAIVYIGCNLRMKAYDKAVADRSVRNPAQAVSEMKGFYRCCIYKWKKQRVRDQWTLLCSTCPRLMKKAKEVPNVMRDILKMDKKFTFRKGKGSEETGTCILPAVFERVVADCVASCPVFGMCFGERVGRKHPKHLPIPSHSAYSMLIKSGYIYIYIYVYTYLYIRIAFPGLSQENGAYIYSGLGVGIIT